MNTDSKLWDNFSLAILIFGPLTIALNWHKLPALVPMHYGLLGTPDSWGPKETILILPVVAIFTYFFFSFGQKHPERSNVPWKINDTNRAETYALVKQLLIWEKLVMVILFTYLQAAGVAIALKQWEGLGVWFAPIMLVAVFAPIVHFFLVGKKFKDVKH